MRVKLSIKGHIIDSLILSKILDEITQLNVLCYATDVKVGRRREDISEAVFVIEEENEKKLNKAIEVAKKHGAVE